ncbi:MAG: GNAT family N-acetyltransferase [Verrucomicrobia bacterium]|nr:GNAT family N-acetyltransferase [Verrucomicrobiota bacterium]
MAPPHLKLRPASVDDAAALAALHVAARADLTARFGPGSWSGNITERGVLFDLRNAHVYVLKERGSVLAALTLATRKPWAIDRSYFSPIPRPLYLTSMAVLPDRQHQGLGRSAVVQALEIAREWPAQGIFLDAFDAPAGAGEFYRKCGFREVGRATYRNVALIYFEMLV